MREQKSRKHRRIRVRTPGGKLRIIYKNKRPAKAQCGRCGVILKGVPTERNAKMMNMAKSKKRPERPYGGVLCTKCMRELMLEKARSMYREEQK